MNGTLAQVQAKYQRPANAIYRVGPVGSGFFFTSVQAAIDQAVADGFTSASNLATVEIAPGTYTENVVLKPGVNLIGVLGSVFIDGTCTYPVSNGLTRAENAILLSNLVLTVLNGRTLEVSGVDPCQLTLNGVQLIKQTGGDAQPAYSLTNTGAGSRVRFNAGSLIDYNVATGTAMNCERGSTEFRQRNTSVGSTDGVTFGAVAALTNSASLSVWGCENWFNGNATQIIDLQSATAVVNLRHTAITNTLAGGHGILYTAAGTARLRWCTIQIDANVAGYIGKFSGAAGIFQQGSNVIIGSNRQVQIGLTINTDNSTVIATA